MRATLVLVAALAVAGSGVVHAAPARQSSGSILLLSDRDGHPSLYAVNADGHALKRIVGNADDARWSPDGSWIAFRRGIDLFAIATRGGLPKRLGQGGDFTWALDSRRVAYTTGSGISVVDVSTRRRVVLTNPPDAQDIAPAWSTKGSRIVFLRRTACGWTCLELYVMDGNGSHARRLAVNGLGPGPPAWSPDGKQVAYQGNVGVWVVTVPEGRKRLLTNKISGGAPPAWSPRGDAIALSGYEGEKTGVWTIRPSGGRLTSVFRDPDNRSPAAVTWSVDGTRLAVTTDGQSGDVWVVSTTSRARARLTQGWRYGYLSKGLQWQPKGRTTAGVRGTKVSPAVPTDSTAAGDVLRTRGPVAKIAADGVRVVIVYGNAGLYESQGVSTDCIETWNPVARTLVRLHHQCLKVLDAGIAGSRVAWVDFSHGAGTDAFGVSSATLHHPASTLADVCASPPPDARPQPCRGPALDLHGDGSLLVFETFGQSAQCFYYPFRGCPLPRLNAKLWRLDGTHAVQIDSSSGALTPLAADAGRILVDHEDGRLELVTGDGASLRTLDVDRAHMVGASLQGRDLVVQMQSRVNAYDARTGALSHEWTLPSADAKLADVSNGVAAFIAPDGVHLLRLDNGATAVVRVPGSAPVDAELEPAGLFYARNVADAAYRGRVVFVPASKLPLH